MSAVAAAVPTSALPSMSNMEEDEDTKKEQQPTEKVVLVADEEDIEEPMILEAKSEQVLSEAEHQQLQEQAALVVDAQLRAMAVSTTTTRRQLPDTAPPSTATSTGTRSAGESIDDLNGKDRLKPFIRTCTKFESGSGSGDQDGMILMEDVAAKKRKTRRGKPKHRKLKPYSKQQPSYQQRLRSRASTGRPTKTGRQPPAPYNTTQFLMEDHNELPDLDEKIAGAAGAGGSAAVAAMAAEMHSHFSKAGAGAPPRTRDSSFSIDSDEDNFYSSPEDEEEFLTKEFAVAYEDLHAERLGALTKAELIQEYIQLEAKVDLLTKRLRSKNASANASAANQSEPSADGEPKDGNELAKKIKIFQQRIEELVAQNEQLRRENELLRKQRRAGSPMSSVDSESDSDSSSNHSNCSCSNHNKASPGLSSPVPASYHARRDKSGARRKSSSVSSVDSESDSTSGDSSCPDSSPKNNAATTTTTTATTTTTTSNSADVANGHATSLEIDSLPTT